MANTRLKTSWSPGMKADYISPTQFKIEYWNIRTIVYWLILGHTFLLLQIKTNYSYKTIKLDFLCQLNFVGIDILFSKSYGTHVAMGRRVHWHKLIVRGRGPSLPWSTRASKKEVLFCRQKSPERGQRKSTGKCGVIG